MRLPKEIVGRNKVRDAGIITTWIKWHELEKASEEPVSALKRRISEKFSIVESYIYQILRKNKVYIKPDLEWEKQKMLWRIDREIAQKGKSKKDVSDLIEQKRKLLDGDKQIVQQTNINIHSFKDFVNNAYRNNGEAIKLSDGKEDTSRLPS